MQPCTRVEPILKHPTEIKFGLHRPLAQVAHFKSHFLKTINRIIEFSYEEYDIV